MRACLITSNGLLREDVKSVFENAFQSHTLCIASDLDVANTVIADADLIVIDVDFTEDLLRVLHFIRAIPSQKSVIVCSKSEERCESYLRSANNVIDHIVYPTSYDRYFVVFGNAALTLSGKQRPFTDQDSLKSPFAALSEDELILDEKISSIFISIGIAPNISGYAYLREGVKIAIKNPLSINHITKVIYPQVAERFDSTASKVERSMRHAISSAWNRGRLENLNHFLGINIYSSLDRPTNGEFIALIADKLLLEGA